MLNISREANVKIGKHAWNVHPLEGFGFLLGKTFDLTALASLPCSKTSKWYEYGDRWNGVLESMKKANDTAIAFQLDIVGVYGSVGDLKLNTVMPNDKILTSSSLGIVFIYRCICCPAHSRLEVFKDGGKLNFGVDFVISGGKRLDDKINQKRVLKHWLSLFGKVDYHNGYTGKPKNA